LKDGSVVGRGTHEELMDGCPTYRAIADSQTRGEGDHGGR
jgi:ATP-binding cassette subfamily B protein